MKLLVSKHNKTPSSLIITNYTCVLASCNSFHFIFVVSVFAVLFFNPMNASDLDLVISRLSENDPELRKNALCTLHDEVRSALGSSFNEIQTLLDRHSAIASHIDNLKGDEKRHLYDLLSVISILDNPKNVLRYRLLGGVTELTVWSHQYVRKLVCSILDVIYGNSEYEEFGPVIEPIISFLFAHNSEAEAIDFAIEVSGLQPRPIVTEQSSAFLLEIRNLMESDPEDEPNSELMKEKTAANATKRDTDKPTTQVMDRTVDRAVFKHVLARVDADNRERVLTYLEELGKFYDLNDEILEVKQHDPSRYLVGLLKTHRTKDAEMYVRRMEDGEIKKQCLYILARNSIRYSGNNEEERILSNRHMYGVFQAVATALEVLPTKKLDYMFKGLNRDRVDVTAVANGLVNFAYGRDPVFFPQEGDYRVKEEQMEQLKSSSSPAAIASVGLIHAFNPSTLYSLYESRIFDSPEIGALLAVALSSYRIGDPDSSILNLLSIFLSSSDSIAALFAISILYYGTHCQEVYELVFPLLSCADNSVSLFSIYVLGSVFPGDIEILSSCVDVYAELKKDPVFTHYAMLGIALFFYKLEMVPNSDAKRIFDRLDPHVRVLARGFIGIGSGSPELVDAILAESFIGEIDALLESLGLIASCMVGLGDSIAMQLVERIATSSLLLDSPHLKSIVPLCLALLYASNPRPEVVDILERSINSGECSVNAIVSLGIVGAGTCSSRILTILDSNFSSVYKDPRASAALIYARGLVNLGKGLFTLSPLAYNKQIIMPRSFVALISTLFIFLESAGSIKDHSYLLYMVVGAVHPRYVHVDVTDPEEPTSQSATDQSPETELTVRIGQPVETVGLAGKPSRISATVVHTLPAILNEREMAESDIPLCTAYVEDIVVLRGAVSQG